MSTFEAGGAPRVARGRASGLLIAVALLGCVGMVAQQRQVQSLRQTRAGLLEQAAGSVLDARTATPDLIEASPEAKPERAGPEVLELRGEISRLLRRKQELQRVQLENVQLRSQLATRTNTPAETGFVPGYIRKGVAQNVGFGQPEDTLQTFLWALARHDMTNAAMAFTPEFGEQIIKGLSRESATEALIGMGIASRTNLPDGRVLFEVQIMPGMPSPKIGFRQINGEWKIDEFR